MGGKTLLDHNLDRLAAFGIRRAVINAHYLADQIEAHARQRNAPELVVSDERAKLLDSGGGLAKAVPLLGEGPFFTLNADTIWLDGPRGNLARMAEAWDPARMDLLLLVAPAVATIGWGNRGDFAMDADGRLRRPKAGEVTPFAYAGVALLTAPLLRDRPEVFSLNRVFDEAIARDRLFGLRLDGVFMHVGTPEALAEAERALARFDG